MVWINQKMPVVKTQSQQWWWLGFCDNGNEVTGNSIGYKLSDRAKNSGQQLLWHQLRKATSS
jgi:hypothetical protein